MKKDKMKDKEIYVDVFTASTYNSETAEICCPNCGSWTYVEDLTTNGFGECWCPLCRYADEEIIK